MIKLYHIPRAVCPQKVRLTLAEKGLAFESRLLTRADLHSPEYLALNPYGYVPTLVHGSIVFTESRTISEYLEDAFPGTSLMPSTAQGKAKVRNWSKQIDDSLHLNVFILSFVTSFSILFEAMAAEAQAAALPLIPLKRHIALELLDRGQDSVFFNMAVDRFRTLLTHMEKGLSQSEWLSGDAYGLADVDYTPYLRRLEELGLWQLLRRDHPEVRRWFSAVRSRPSFAEAITAWETEADQIREAKDIAVAQPIFEAALAARRPENTTHSNKVSS